MIFNDYAASLNSQKSELAKLETIKNQLEQILQLHDGWAGNTFISAYERLIYSSNINSVPNSDELVHETEKHFIEMREQLIAIDFLEFGEILLKFKNVTIEPLSDISNKTIKELKSVYKVIHYYKTLVEKADRAANYIVCINSIREMIDIYNRFIFMVEYVNLIDLELCHGIQDEGLEIRLLNDTFQKETYSIVTEPIYKIYEKLCEMGNIDCKKEQLQIVRMETGSFFIKFIGNTAILKLIAKIIESWHNHIIRNYTRDGQKQNLVETTALFEKQFNIMKQMKELGISVDQNEEVAKETLVLLMKQSNILLSSSPDIQVNKKVLSKSKDIKKALECDNYKILPLIDIEDVINK